MNTICIYIEKYYFNEKYFRYVKEFLNDLKNNFSLYIYIPDILIIKNIIINKDIYNYLKCDFCIEKNEPNYKIDGLIIFSDYDKGMYFDTFNPFL